MPTQLLTQQENNFKGFIQILVNSTDQRMDNMIKEVQDLKISLQSYQKGVEGGSQELTIKCKDAHKNFITVCESVLSMTGKADYLEGQSKLNNIFVESIPESPHES